MYLFVVFISLLLNFQADHVLAEQYGEGVFGDQRKELIAYAKKYIGSPYKYGGKSRSGFDCSGFAHFIYKKFDIHFSGPSHSLVNLGKKIKKNKALPGDLAFFARGKKIFHVAIVLSNDKDGLTVIHSTSSKGVCVNNISQSSYWKNKLFQIRRVL